MLLFVAAAVQAQSRQAAPPPEVQTGQYVWIVAADGRGLDGRVQSVTSDSIVLRKGTVTARVKWSDVRTAHVRVGDPLTNGLLIGAVVGGVGGWVTSALIMKAICSECDNSSEAQQIAIAVAGIGAGVGAFIDSRRFRRREAQKPSMTLAPILGSRVAGIAGVVRW